MCVVDADVYCPDRLEWYRPCEGREEYMGCGLLAVSRLRYYPYNRRGISASQVLIFSLVLSHLDYCTCNSLLAGCPQYLTDKLPNV